MPKSCNFQADDLLICLDITLKADVNAISPIVDSVLDTARRMGLLRHTRRAQSGIWHWHDRS